MRMIDADMADVVIIYDKSNELTQVSAIREYIKRQKAFLDKFPTIDAVPVVRCKDCARCVPYKGVPFCNKWRTFPEVELDGFCSYAERKEGADNDT